MKAISILNDVLGPVMRGPSSSHTAGSWRIARLAAHLLGAPVRTARVAFDPDGSYGRVFRQQGVDLAMAAGFLGQSLTDDDFESGLDTARDRGMHLEFVLEPIPAADHPNTTHLTLTAADGRRLQLRGRSTGGGAFLIDRLDEWPVQLDGTAHEYLVDCALADEEQLSLPPADHPDLITPPTRLVGRWRVLWHIRSRAPLDCLDSRPTAAGIRIHTAPPLVRIIRGRPRFADAAAMVRLATEQGLSLGQVALAGEAELLGLSEAEVMDEMIARYAVMRDAVQRGLAHEGIEMQLLPPSAGHIFTAADKGRLPTGGLHTRAAARAMAVMHVNGSRGVVCAAPTGGSAGVLPGVAVTLAEEWGLSDRQVALALLAAGAVGIVVATRATFAAEVCGCQVEIGAAGAMAAAAVVEAAGGSAGQAADAAAIAFQNTMGSVCDLVQGIVEIPCHTRNAVAASSAFVCADLVLGGYLNPVPLDETVDAVYAVGKMLPAELRCTARGGLAMAPSARALKYPAGNGS